MQYLGIFSVSAWDIIAKDPVQRRFGKSPAWRSARASFQQRAGLAIFLTRWLITALAIPTNLIAGGSGYKFSHFMAYDIAGEIMWISLYGGLGYLFGSQWELVYDFIEQLRRIDFGSGPIRLWYQAGVELAKTK